MLRYKFSGPTLTSPLIKNITIQAYKLFWVHINISHKLPKYSPYYCPTWAPTNIPYISPINYLGLLTNTTHYILYTIQLGFSTKYLSHYYQIGPQSYTISTKKPKSPTKLSSKARCYIAPSPKIPFIPLLINTHLSPVESSISFTKHSLSLLILLTNGPHYSLHILHPWACPETIMILLRKLESLSLPSFHTKFSHYLL